LYFVLKYYSGFHRKYQWDFQNFVIISEKSSIVAVFGTGKTIGCGNNSTETNVSGGKL